MFWRKPRIKSAREKLLQEIEDHREAIRLAEDFDEDFPDPVDHPEVHQQAANLEAMKFSHVTDASRQVFERTVSAGRLLNKRLQDGPWRVIENGAPLTDHFSHYTSYKPGRHYKLFYGKLRAGTLVIGDDGGAFFEDDGVHLRLTFRFPFLYEFGAIHPMLHTLIWQMSDGTVADMDRRKSLLTQKLLETLWGIQRDEVYVFQFDEAGPATVMFRALEKLRNNPI